MSGPSTPKHSADKRARKRAAGLRELRIYVPAAEHDRLRWLVQAAIEACYSRDAGNPSPPLPPQHAGRVPPAPPA